MAETLTLFQTEQERDLDSIKRQIEEISKARELGFGSVGDSSGSDLQDLLEDFKSEYQAVIKKLELDEFNVSVLDNDGLDLYLDSLKKEISLVPEENSKLTGEIDRLMNIVAIDKNKVDGGLEECEYLIRCDNSQIQESENWRGISRFEYKYEMFKLDQQMKENEMQLKHLEDLENDMKSVEILQQCENLLSEIRVLEFKDNCLRLFIKGPIPNSNGKFFGQNLDFGTEPIISDHELMIEFNEETTVVKKLEIFPNDLPINEIFDSIKSARDLSDIVRLVQHHIIFSAEKRILLKDAKKSRR